MKKIVGNYYLLVLLLSFLPLIGIFFTPLLLHTHDGFVHLARIGAYVKALHDGQFPVRWAGDLNYGYGMPLFNFMYQLPYMIASVLVFFGIGLVNSFKLSLGLSFLLSGIFMFAFANTFFRDSKKAFFVTIFYQFAPFRMVELLIRGSFGEVYTYAFFPLLLFGICKMFEKNSFKNYLITAIAVMLLVLSHNALSLVFFGVTIAFILFFIQKKKNVLFIGFALLNGLLLCAYYWMPALLEHKYTYGDLLMKNLYKQYFPPFQNFFIPNPFNFSQLLIGGISVQLGLFETLGILLCIILLYKKDTQEFFLKKVYIFSFLLLVITFFFMQPISRFAWEHLSLLRQFQFPWRFLGLVAFATAMTSVSFLSFSFFQKKLVYVSLIILVIVSVAFYWKPQLGYDNINEQNYWNFPKNTTYFGETDVIWSEGPATSYPLEKVSFIEGAGTVSHLIKKSNIHTYTINSSSSGKLVDRTEYFPGWRVYVNGKAMPIEFQNMDYRGLITFPVPKGESTVRVVFGETPVRLFADILSLVGILLLTLCGLLHKKVFYEKKRI